jgi:hypothetical protein
VEKVTIARELHSCSLQGQTAAATVSEHARWWREKEEQLAVAAPRAPRMCF